MEQDVHEQDVMDVTECLNESYTPSKKKKTIKHIVYNSKIRYVVPMTGTFYDTTSLVGDKHDF